MKRKNLIILTTILLAIEGKSQKIADKVIIEEKNKLYSIKLKNLILEINPLIGGRITSLKIDGKDFLTGKEVNDFNWGSTFWISPQSDWDWPPSAELDNKEYTAKVEANDLIMISQKDPKTGLVVTKRFSGNGKTNSYTLKYTINNHSNTPQKVAPWEVTRVRPKGLAFFPIGKGERRGGLLPLTIEKDGIGWFTYKEDRLPEKGDRQLYTDGSEGWLAEVNDNYILVQKFPDIPFEKNAPKEGEVELYASPVAAGKSYVEIEHQGAYNGLQAGESVHWEVNWYLTKLPANIKAEAGNKLLVSYVRKLIK